LSLIIGVALGITFSTLRAGAATEKIPPRGV